MGAGDGQVNYFTRLVKALRRKEKTADRKENEISAAGKKTPVSFTGSPVPYLKKSVLLVSTYCVELDSVVKLKKMAKYRINCGLSLLDRFPQNEVDFYNDGPKVGLYEPYLGESNIYKALKEKENKLFETTEIIIPDLIIRINISAETSMNRKPDQKNIKDYENKIELLKRITYHGAKIVDIDGEQPYENEVLEIKRLIWDML